MGEEPSEYDMASYRVGDTLIMESFPKKDDSYMLVRLDLAGHSVITGSWHESTAPKGMYKGAQYFATGQLIINPETNFMEGKWVGSCYDRKLKQMRIYSGNWEIKPIDE